MSSLRRWAKCGAFVTSDRCPSCRGALFRATKLGLLATALGSGAFAMTLMACYGCADCTFDDYDSGDPDAGTTRPDAPLTPVRDAGNGPDASNPEPPDSSSDAPHDAGTDADADQ